MQLTSFLAIAAAINAPAVAGFKVIAYGDWDCKGNEATLNVQDNTCRTSGVADTWSIWITNYGGKAQRGRFVHGGKNCLTDVGVTKYWVDGGDGGFKKGKCINFSDAVTAMGSSLFE